MGASMTAKWPLVTNNYNIRSFAGSDVYRLPFGHINQDHLIRAKATLQQFDSVFVVSKNLTRDIEADTNWNCAVPKAMNRLSASPGGTQGIVDHLRSQWPATDW